MLSDNNGTNWVRITAIQNISDGSTVHGVRDSLHARWITVREDGTCTMILSNRLVASSKDYGRSWKFNGFFTGLPFGSGMNRVSRTPEGAIFCSIGRSLFLLRSEDDSVITVSELTPSFLAIGAINSVRLVGITTEGCYYSKDGGHTWYISSFAPSHQVDNGSIGIHSAYIERLARVGDLTLMYIPENDAVLVVEGSNVRFEYTAALYSRPWYYNCDDDQYARSGSPVSTFDGHSVSGTSNSFLIDCTKNASAVESTPSEVDGPLFYCTRPDLGRYLFADSLYIQFSDSSSWYSTVAGLPRYMNLVTQPSCLIESKKGALVCGFRGLSFIENDTVRTIPGGIYTSTDSGRSWNASMCNTGFNPYVWHIVESVDSFLYASVSLVESTTGSSNYTTFASAILRSTDYGATWNSVYEFNDLQRAATASGHRMAIDSNGCIYALGDRKIAYSTDRGQTWLLLSDEFSPLCCLSDIIIGNNNTIWVASNEGVFSFDKPTSEIDVGEDNNRYSSVWLYPTPTTSIATFRVNNLDLIDVRYCTLKLFDSYGSEIDDLTPILRNGGRSGQLEFSYTTTALHTGVYVLVLKDQRGSIEKYKMMVVR